MFLGPNAPIVVEEKIPFDYRSRQLIFHLVYSLAYQPFKVWVFRSLKDD